MELDQLMSRYFRLRQELSIAYNAQPWHSGRIDRLANQLALTEREIAANAANDDVLAGIETVPAAPRRVMRELRA